MAFRDVTIENQILRSNTIAEGGLYWVLVYDSKGSEVDFKDTSQIKVELTAPGCAKGVEGSCKITNTGATLVSGFARKAKVKFKAKVTVTQVDFKGAKFAVDVVKLRVITYATGPAPPASSCKAWPSSTTEAAFSNMIGTKTDPRNAFWIKSQDSTEVWCKVDKSCAPDSKLFYGNITPAGKGKTFIMPCDRAENQGNLPVMYTGHIKAGKCYPRWIFCDPNRYGSGGTIGCWTGKQNCPGMGDLIRIDKTPPDASGRSGANQKHRECYVVTAVHTGASPPADCTNCQKLPCADIDDASKKGCTRAMPNPDTPGDHDRECLRMDHAYVEKIGGPGTKCTACGGTTSTGSSYHLAEMLARTLQDMGWGENIGGFKITKWRQRGVALDGSGYADYEAENMRAYGHTTRERFSIPGSSAVLRKAGKTKMNMDKPCAINEVSLWYAVNASFQTSWAWLERWRQQIEMSAHTANASDIQENGCPAGAICEGDYVYRIVETWPPEYLEHFIRETASTTASIQVGGSINRWFEFGMSFAASASETKEGGSYPTEEKNVNIGARAWVNLKDLISYNKRMTGKGGGDDGSLGIAEDTIRVQIDFGAASYSGSMKKYQEEWQGKPDLSKNKEWGNETKHSFSDTLFKTMNVTADWDIKLTNGWKVNISGFSYTDGEVVMTPALNMSGPIWKDKVIMTIAQDLTGAGSIGLAYSSKENMLADYDVNATMFCSAGILFDTSKTFTGESRYSPSLGFYGSVGDVDPELSKILSGFEYDCNLIEGKLKIRSANTTLYQHVSNSTYEDADGNDIPFTKANLNFKMEAQTGDPNAPSFSARFDFDFQHSVIQFEQAWMGAIIFRAKGTLGLQYGGSGGFGGGIIGQGGGVGGYVWCGFEWHNTVLSWLNFPVDVIPGIGLGIGFDFTINAQSKAGKSNSAGGFLMKLGLFSFKLKAADSLRQHLRRQRTPLVQLVPLIGKCLGNTSGITSNKNVGTPLLSVLGPKEDIIRYLLRFHAMKSLFAIENAIKMYNEERIAKEKGCEDEYKVMWQAAPPKDRHNFRWHWHQMQHNQGPEPLRYTKIGGLMGGGTRAWTAREQTWVKCDGKGTDKRKGAGLKIAQQTGNPGEHFIAVNKEYPNPKGILNWRIRDEFLGPPRSNYPLERVLYPEYTKCLGKLTKAPSPMCMYKQHCYTKWLKKTNACSWIRQKYDTIDKNPNSTLFDLNSYPQLRGQLGLVHAIINAIHEFMWNKVFVGCDKGWNFTKLQDIEAFIEYLRPFYGSFDEFGDPRTTKVDLGNKATWQETKTCLVAIFCNGITTVSGNRTQGVIDKAVDNAGIKMSNGKPILDSKGDFQKEVCKTFGGNCNYFNSILCDPFYLLAGKVSGVWNGIIQDGCPSCTPGTIGENNLVGARNKECQDAFHKYLMFDILYKNLIHDMWLLTLGCTTVGYECCDAGRDRNGKCKSQAPSVNLGGNAEQMNDLNGTLRMLLRANSIILDNKSGGETRCNAMYLWELFHEIMGNPKVETALINANTLLHEIPVCNLASEGKCVSGRVNDNDGLSKYDKNEGYGPKELQDRTDGTNKEGYADAVTGGQCALYWPTKESMGCLEPWHNYWPDSPTLTDAKSATHPDGFNCFSEVWKCAKDVQFKASDDIAINSAHYFFCHLCQAADSAGNDAWFDGDHNRAHPYAKCRTQGRVDAGLGSFGGIDQDQDGEMYPNGPDHTKDAGRSYGAHRQDKTYGACGSWYEVDGPGWAALSIIPIFGGDIDYEMPLRELNKTWESLKYQAQRGDQPQKKIYDWWTDSARINNPPDLAGNASPNTSTFKETFEKGAWDSIYKRHPYSPPASVIASSFSPGHAHGYGCRTKDNDLGMGAVDGDWHGAKTGGVRLSILNPSHNFACHYDWACWFMNDYTVKMAIPLGFWTGSNAKRQKQLLESVVYDWTYNFRGAEYDAHKDTEMGWSSSSKVQIGGTPKGNPLWEALPSNYIIEVTPIQYSPGLGAAKNPYSCNTFKMDLTELKNIPTTNRWRQPKDVYDDMFLLLEAVKKNEIYAAFLGLFKCWRWLEEAKNEAINNGHWTRVLDRVEHDLRYLAISVRIEWIHWLNRWVAEVQVPCVEAMQAWEKGVGSIVTGNPLPFFSAGFDQAADLKKMELRSRFWANSQAFSRTINGMNTLFGWKPKVEIYKNSVSTANRLAWGNDSNFATGNNLFIWVNKGNDYTGWSSGGTIDCFINTFTTVGHSPLVRRAINESVYKGHIQSASFSTSGTLGNAWGFFRSLGAGVDSPQLGGKINIIGAGLADTDAAPDSTTAGVPWHFIVNGNMDYLLWSDTTQRDGDKSSLANILRADESVGRSVGAVTLTVSGVLSSSAGDSANGHAWSVQFASLNRQGKERMAAMLSCKGVYGKTGMTLPQGPAGSTTSSGSTNFSGQSGSLAGQSSAAMMQQEKVTPEQQQEINRKQEEFEKTGWRKGKSTLERIKENSPFSSGTLNENGEPFRKNQTQYQPYRKGMPEGAGGRTGARLASSNNEMSNARTASSNPAAKASGGVGVGQESEQAYLTRTVRAGRRVQPTRRERGFVEPDPPTN